MSQRNPLNERYQADERLGKTRKSAASAKPVSKAAASVREPAPKSKRQKKAEARERERKAQAKAQVENRIVPDVPNAEYSKLRRVWWGLLIAGIVFTILSWIMVSNEVLASYSIVAMVLAYVFIIAALALDLTKMRKMRKRYGMRAQQDKSKAARRAQKAARAEARQKAAEQARTAKDASGADAAATDSAASGKKGLLSFLKRGASK